MHTYAISEMELLRGLPIALNGYLGDSMLQWKNTVDKLCSLTKSNHQGDIMLPTKKIITDSQIKFLQGNCPNVWIFFAVTGLDELNLGSLDEYKKSYYNLCEKFENIVCAIRPIIPGQNDKVEVVEPILEMVKSGRKLLTYTGYKDIHDATREQYHARSLYAFIEEYCESNGILSAAKCIHIVGKARGTKYLLDSPLTNGVKLAKIFGYDLTVLNDHIAVNNSSSTLTKGDLNFVMLLTRFKTTSNGVIPSQVLSKPITPLHPLVCTSSWFQWARQVPCAVGCSYCFADYNSVIRTEPDNFGCNPIELFQN